MRWKRNYKACITKFKRERALLLRRHGRSCSHVTQYANNGQLIVCDHHWLTQRIKWLLVQVEQLLPSEILMRARNELLDKNMTGVSTALLLILSEKHEGTVLLRQERSATRAYARCSDRPRLGKGDPDGLPDLEDRGKGHLATHSYDGRSLLHGHPEWQAILPLHA